MVEARCGLDGRQQIHTFRVKIGKKIETSCQKSSVS
jgi:hypothetical protein